jgi:hypothetical protein
MRNVKLLAAALLAAATLATPALAATHAARRDVTDGRMMSTMHRDGGSCVHAPRVGAFATEPWTYAAPCEPNTGY